MKRTDEILESLEVGKIYRYVGNGEFEIVDLMKIIAKALEKCGSKLP